MFRWSGRSKVLFVFLAAGFESSEESQHVHEITEKITHFMIETDTDTSSFPTDTGESGHGTGHLWSRGGSQLLASDDVF